MRHARTHICAHVVDILIGYLASGDVPVFVAYVPTPYIGTNALNLDAHGKKCQAPVVVCMDEFATACKTYVDYKHSMFRQHNKTKQGLEHLQHTVNAAEEKVSAILDSMNGSAIEVHVPSMTDPGEHTVYYVRKGVKKAQPTYTEKALLSVLQAPHDSEHVESRIHSLLDAAEQVIDKHTKVMTKQKEKRDTEKKRALARQEREERREQNRIRKREREEAQEKETRVRQRTEEDEQQRIEQIKDFLSK